MDGSPVPFAAGGQLGKYSKVIRAIGGDRVRARIRDTETPDGAKITRLTSDKRGSKVKEPLVDSDGGIYLVGP